MKHGHSRRSDLPFARPDPPFRVVLVNPEIPPNTGNVARLCAATGTELHLVEPMGFKITDAKLKRAGLDYWDAINVRRHASFEAFLADGRPSRLFLFSTGGARSYLDVAYAPGDTLVFGCETKGLPDALLRQFPDSVVCIPIRTDHVRSLNLSSSVAVAVYEALRQTALHGNPL